MSLLKIYSFLFFFYAFLHSSTAQYYDVIDETETCSALKTDLSNLINTNFINLDYNLIPNIMCMTTDVDASGILIDRYSSITSYNCNDFGGGSSSGEGQMWNREHVFPSSWFNGSSGNIPFSDLHNLFPSDSYINQEKSNLPLGEVVSNNINSSISQVGEDANNCTNSCNGGASGEVFEPADQYKGDFARVYLYMAVMYENNAASWENDSPCGNAAMTGDSFKFYTTCYLNMLLRWHLMDPPDQLEIDRNNAIFGIQGNRNPFVDRPEFATQIWGNNCCPNCDPIFIDASPSCVGINSTFSIDYTINGASIGPYTLVENTSAINMSGLGSSGTISGFLYTNQMINILSALYMKRLAVL